MENAILEYRNSRDACGVYVPHFLGKLCTNVVCVCVCVCVCMCVRVCVCMCVRVQKSKGHKQGLEAEPHPLMVSTVESCLLGLGLDFVYIALES